MQPARSHLTELGSRAERAAQQLLEVTVRHQLDGVMTRAGFELEPHRVPGPGGHSAMYQCPTEPFVLRQPRLETGRVGLTSYVDVWIHDESLTGRMRLETDWGRALQAAARGRSEALAELAAWLGGELGVSEATASVAARRHRAG